MVHHSMICYYQGYYQLQNDLSANSVGMEAESLCIFHRHNEDVLADPDV